MFYLILPDEPFPLVDAARAVMTIMPAPTTTDELVELVRQSGLLEPAKLNALLASHPAGFSTPAALVAQLHADGLLTEFHTGQLMRGKHRGFFLGRYKILDRIGLGGMGQVFLAEHGTMRRRAALKVLPPERAENEYSRSRFIREARAAAQLDHPNLVRAFDFDQDGEVVFLVMEFVDGVTFHDLVVRSGALDPNRAAHYLWQAANGLEYLHACGMIHRDVKPANLLVDRQGVVKILDLGLVRSDTDADELTRGEGVKILGTADYLAPEQAVDCSGVDNRADIYGLGATAYYLLTGKPPFEGEKIAQKLIAHQTKAVRPVHDVRPEVPVGLSNAVTKMLAKKPADRYQTPAEVMAAIEPWAVVPPSLPTEAEIPAVTAGAGGIAGAVNLAAPRSSRVTVSGAGTGTGGMPSSGSAIKYHSDTKLSTAGGSSAAAAAAANALKTPIKPITRATDESRGKLPVLPAQASHGTRPNAQNLPRPGFTRPTVPPAPVLGPPPARKQSKVVPARRIALFVAIAATVALAVFTALSLPAAGGADQAAAPTPTTNR